MKLIGKKIDTIKLKNTWPKENKKLMKNIKKKLKNKRKQLK